MNTREATTKIKDGMRLRIDGGEGRSLCAGLKSIQTEHFKSMLETSSKHFSRSTFLFFIRSRYDLWLARIAEAIQITGAEHKTFAELEECLPGPSSLRALVQK